MTDGRPPGLNWHYSRAEIAADAVIHALGVSLGLVGVAILFVLAARVAEPVELTSVLVYGLGLLAVLGVSAAYNLWPLTRVKWWLRRFDHSAIYLLIAGTYTPFLSQMKAGLVSIGLLVGVWGTALVGTFLKFRFPGRFDRLSIALYLVMSWSGVLAYDAVSAALPASTLAWIAAGGIIYTAGVVFHVWETLRFHNAIWHAFVLVAAACHYRAVLDCMVLARA
ncbi:MAG TPA: hemolysin III family protein [Beijerinckiaceae bacterium]|jgi:hemolysin III